MLTDQSPAIQFSQLLDALPDAVVWMRAIYDGNNQIVNFQIDYSNRKAEELAKGAFTVRIGSLIRGDYEDNRPLAEQAFREMQQIMVTGLPAEYTYFHPLLNGWYLANRTKLGDGVLSVTRNVSALKTTEQETAAQTELLQTILDTSLNNIFVYEAIRDETGVIQDFQVRLANPAAREDVMARKGIDITDATLLTFRPDSRETGQFNLFCQVIETGKSVRMQQFYPDLKEWYDTAITKLGDGCVVTGINISQQKWDESAHKRQTDLLNSVLDSSSSGIMAFESVRDAGGTIVDFTFLSVNEAACQLVGRTADEMIGTPMLSVFPGNVESGLMAKYVHSVQTGEPTHTEVYYNHDGLDFWLDVAARKLGDGFVVTFTDVSNAKRAQQLIEETAELLQAVIDNSPTALVLYEPMYDERGLIIDFRYKLANPIAATTTGQLVDDLPGNTISTLFPLAVQAGYMERMIAVSTTGEPQHYEQHFLGDGVDFWAEITIVKQGNDVLTVFQYISDLKRAQQELEHSQTELQTVIDTSQTGIFLFSPVCSETGEVVDFRFRIANRQLASYVGQEPDAVAGALGSTWFPDYKTNGLFDFYRKTYLTGESQRFDFHYDGSGIDVWLDIMSTKMGDEVLVTFGDYTPLKKLQQQLETSVVELQRSNRNLEEFAYIASHDLQEPLRKIQSFGDIIQERYALAIDEEGADLIRRMQAAAARMQALIKDILAYSRVSIKRENHSPVDLNRTLQDVLTDLETIVTDKRATVTIEPLPTVNGDELQLRQLFQNLISNALKFGKAGQMLEITLTSGVVWGHDMDLNLTPADASQRYHLIEVRDNGIGFEPHHAERIFQVFQRLHGRSEYPGTGIGLAIVKKVVENHQGYIVADGKPNEGAVFRILLP